MEMERVAFDLFLKRDINIMLDINVNSSLFNCKEEGPCKSGLVIHYHNDPDLIRVYIKNSKDSIEATTKEEIKILQGWLKRAIKIAASWSYAGRSWGRLALSIKKVSISEILDWSSEFKPPLKLILIHKLSLIFSGTWIYYFNCQKVDFLMDLQKLIFF